MSWAAWVAAKRTVDGQVANPANTPAADAEIDAPLPATIIAFLAAAWARRYPNISWRNYFTAADSLIARVYREFHRRTPQVHSVSKTKSIMSGAIPQEHTRLALGAAMLTVGVEETHDPTGVIEYYVCLRLLVQAYAYAGSHEVPSQADANRMVIFAPLSPSM